MPPTYAVRLALWNVIAACLLLPAAPSRGESAIRAEAYRGEPFGIARVRVDAELNAGSTPWNDDRFTVADDAGRILYPAIDRQPVRRFVQQLLGIGRPSRVTFYFLFRGDEPLDVTVYSPDAERITITPAADPREFGKLVDDWWDATRRRYRQNYREADYPVVVENYLAANWARRLGRDLPEPSPHFLRRQDGATWAAQLTANESYQATIERDLVLGRFGNGERADMRVPEAPVPPPLVLPLPAANVEVEPIASHVPHECFYLRFGNFLNYLWFRDFLRHSEGDLANMVVLRSIDRQMSERFQQQIAIGEGQLARVMGPAVIRDVAIIGFDAYLRDGAAMGILFHASNSALLSRNLEQQRREAMRTVPDATAENVDVAGQQVSFVSSPDGRLRSYYAVDGDFHLVTTSRRLVERFYEASRGEGSLAASVDFRDARAEMPVGRDDTVFLHLSPAFFENLASPRYRVELDRRLKSIGEMRVLQLARLAGRAEGVPAHAVEELMAAELLPRGFGLRPDGSRLVETEDGFRDSLRGVPGWFMPVADMPVEAITAAEARRLVDFERTVQGEVGRFVPLTLALLRLVSDDRQYDRIVADLRLAPYSQTRLAPWAEMLGPADDLRVAPIAGDVVSAEVTWAGLGEPVHLFAGLRDSRPPLMVREGEVRPATPLTQAVRGYVGTWPRPLVLLERFLGRPTGRFDRFGIARHDRLFDLWQRRLDDFFLFSFQRDVLMEVGPQLAMVEAEYPAQLRLWIDDLSDRQIATAVHGFGYMRARDTSASASRFMNSLITQLHVPAAEARDVAEELVGGRFVCPLGGDYELADADTFRRAPFSRDAQRSAPNDDETLPAPAARRLWASTATPPENRFLLTTIPANYTAPLMEWFRGLTLDATRGADELWLHAELDMVHLELEPPTDAAADAGPRLPNLGDFFRNFGRSNEGDHEKQPSDSEVLSRPTELRDQ